MKQNSQRLWIIFPTIMGLCVLLILVKTINWLALIVILPLIMITVAWGTVIAEKNNDWSAFPLWYKKFITETKFGYIIVFLSVILVLLSLIYLGGTFNPEL